MPQVPRHLAILVVTGLVVLRKENGVIYVWLSIDDLINSIEGDEIAQPELNNEENLNAQYEKKE